MERLVFTTFVYFTSKYKNTALGTNENAEWAVTYTRQSGKHHTKYFRKLCSVTSNSRFPFLRFRSALHCGYSGITDKDSGLE
jgi:hypothetical protein